MKTYRYSEWDGSQDFNLDEDEIMDELFRRLMSYGDLSNALWKMQRDGLSGTNGRRVVGIQELLQQLRQRKQSQLDKYKLSSVMDEIRQKLDNVLKTEREGIQRRLDEAKQKAKEGADQFSPEMLQDLLKVVEKRAAENREKLDNLPQDIGGKIKELTKYDFNGPTYINFTHLSDHFFTY